MLGPLPGRPRNQSRMETLPSMTSDGTSLIRCRHLSESDCHSRKIDSTAPSRPHSGFRTGIAVERARYVRRRDVRSIMDLGCVCLRLPEGSRGPTYRCAGAPVSKSRNDRQPAGTTQSPSRRSALVAVVQAADLRKRDDPTGFRSLHWPRLWRILLQSEVRSALVIEVDNPTHIILSGGASVIRGIPGSAVRSPYTRWSSNVGSRCAGAVSKRNALFAA
jgi:hypothetical protein